MQSSTLYFNILIHKLWKIQFWKKLFAIGFPYKHCNFWPFCLPVKMAPKTVIRLIQNKSFLIRFCAEKSMFSSSVIVVLQEATHDKDWCSTIIPLSLICEVTPRTQLFHHCLLLLESLYFRDRSREQSVSTSWGSVITFEALIMNVTCHPISEEEREPTRSGFCPNDLRNPTVSKALAQS